MSSFTINSKTRKVFFSKTLNYTLKSTFKKGLHFKTQIGKKDEALLQVFLTDFFDVIKKVSSNDKEKDDFIYSLKLAMEHYFDCLLNTKMERNKRITQSIMGLEAIWLTANDKETIGYKLKIRASKVLVKLGLDVEEVPKSIGLAYSIRSSYAHGSPIPSDIRRKINNNAININKLEKQVLNYLRISIVVGLLMLDERKTDFVKDLTTAIYDDAKNKEINDKLVVYRDKLRECLPIKYKTTEVNNDCICWDEPNR